jgi:hypothetical protein
MPSDWSPAAGGVISTLLNGLIEFSLALNALIDAAAELRDISVGGNL